MATAMMLAGLASASTDGRRSRLRPRPTNSMLRGSPRSAATDRKPERASTVRTVPDDGRQLPERNHTTMNTNTITIPARFTKGSGKKIAAAYVEKGWEVRYEAGAAGAKMTATYLNGTDFSITVTVTVFENGAFCHGCVLDSRVNINRSFDFDSVSEAIIAAGRPASYLAADRIAADRAAKKKARDERAAECEAVYTATIDTDDDFFRWERKILRDISEQDILFTLDSRHNEGFMAGEAVSLLTASYPRRFAKQILAAEGTYNDATDRCYTLAEASHAVIMRAIADPDATRPETSVPYMRAVQKIAFRFD